jgi:hypothetical protein
MDIGAASYAQEPDSIGTPVFSADQCRAPFSFRYSLALRSLDRLHEDLVVSGMIFVNDDQHTVIRTLGASATRETSYALERLIAAGMDPDTLQAVAHDTEMASKMPYLDYLKCLLPQQRREAIYDLSSVAWGTKDPLFMSHPKLQPELQRLGIKDLHISDLCHQVGPVELDGNWCTAPIIYPLYGGHDSPRDKGFGYYVQVHVLASIGNLPGGGGDITIEDLWSRIELIDWNASSDTASPLLVP